MVGNKHRGQSTIILVAIAVVLVFGAATVTVIALGENFGSSNTAGQSTAESTTAPPSSKKTKIRQSTPAPTLTPTLSPTPTSAPTPTRTLSPTPTSVLTLTRTSTPVSNGEYFDFVSVFIGETAEQTSVPIRVRGIDIKNRTLLIVINATAPSEDSVRRLREIGGISTGYAQALFFHDQGRIEGNATERLRVLEINNTDAPPKTFVINNSLARKFASRQIESPEYSARVLDTVRNQTLQERSLVHRIDKKGGNITLAPNRTDN